MGKESCSIQQHQKPAEEIETSKLKVVKKAVSKKMAVESKKETKVKKTQQICKTGCTGKSFKKAVKNVISSCIVSASLVLMGGHLSA